MNLKRRAVVREIAFARRTMRGPTFGEGEGQVDADQPEQSGGFIEPVQHGTPAKSRAQKRLDYFMGLVPGVAIVSLVMGGVTGAIVAPKGKRLRTAAIGAGAQAVVATALLGVGTAIFGTPLEGLGDDK